MIDLLLAQEAVFNQIKKSEYAQNLLVKILLKQGKYGAVNRIISADSFNLDNNTIMDEIKNSEDMQFKLATSLVKIADINTFNKLVDKKIFNLENENIINAYLDTTQSFAETTSSKPFFEQIDNLLKKNIPIEKIINNEKLTNSFLRKLIYDLRTNNYGINDGDKWDTLLQATSPTNMKLLDLASKEVKYKEKIKENINYFRDDYQETLNKVMFINRELLDKSEEELNALRIFLEFTKEFEIYSPSYAEYKDLIIPSNNVYFPSGITSENIKDYQELLISIGYMNDDIIKSIYWGNFAQVINPYEVSNTKSILDYRSPNLVISPNNEMPYYWHKMSKLLETDSLEFIKDFLPDISQRNDDNNIRIYNRTSDDKNSFFNDRGLPNNLLFNYDNGRRDTLMEKIKNFSSSNNYFQTEEFVKVIKFLNANKNQIDEVSDRVFVETISKIMTFEGSYLTKSLEDEQIHNKNKKLTHDLVKYLKESNPENHFENKVITKGYFSENGPTEAFFRRTLPNNLDDILNNYDKISFSRNFDLMDKNWRMYFNDKELEILLFFSDPLRTPEKLTTIFYKYLNGTNNEILDEYFDTKKEKNFFIELMVLNEFHKKVATAQVWGWDSDKFKLLEKIKGNNQLLSYLPMNIQHYISLFSEINLYSKSSDISGLILRSNDINKYITEDGPTKEYAEKLLEMYGLNLIKLNVPSIISLLEVNEQKIFNFIREMEDGKPYNEVIKLNENIKDDFEKYYQNGSITVELLKKYWGKADISKLIIKPELLNYLSLEMQTAIQSLKNFSENFSISLYLLTNIIPIEVFSTNPNKIYSETELIELMMQKGKLVCYLLGHENFPEKLITPQQKFFLKYLKDIGLDVSSSLFLENIKSDDIDRYFNSGKISKEFISGITKEGKNSFLELYQVEYHNQLSVAMSEKEIVVARAFHSIANNNIRSQFREYVLNNLNNLDNINSERIDVVLILLERINKTNNTQIRNNSSVFINQLINLDNPLEIYEELVKIYDENQLPYFAKPYLTFEHINTDLTDKIVFNSRSISPTLLMLATSYEKQIKPLIFSDLLDITVKSNNRSLKNYLNIIDYNYKLFEYYKGSGKDFTELSDEDKNSLKVYSKYLYILYNNTKEGILLPHVQTNNIAEDIEHISDLFSPNERYDVPDRIVRMFGHGAGYNNFNELMDEISSSTREANTRNRENATSSLVIKKGDFLKGIGNINYLENILQNGSVAKEYLGAYASSDSTPLDTDVAVISTEDLSLNETINSSVASGYGNFWLVLKNDERFKDSREDTNIKIDNYKDKIEYFKSNVLGEQDYGIRTGFPSTVIDSIVTDKIDNRIELEIVKNGFYIPIYEKTTGKLVFTPEDYDNLSIKMNGLKYYNRNDLELSENISSIYLLPNIHEDLNNSVHVTNNISCVIKAAVEEGLKPLNLKMSKVLDSNTVPGQVDFIDTGSTGRGTNTFNDADFDYMMRIDREIIHNDEKLAKLKNNIKKSFKVIGEEVVTTSGDFRFKNVELEGLDEPVDIDITFVQRTDEIDYTTDMALHDKLDTIKEQSPEKYNDVILNILTAKETLKKGEVYKPFRGNNNLVGGLGGIGVENWILQNGGSFIDAANSFLSASKNKNFEEFKSEYQIWDFGHNFTANNHYKYPHDNFIERNMNEMGYETMKTTLKSYLIDLGLDEQELIIK